MTETSTKTLNSTVDFASSITDEAAADGDELEQCGQQFYYSILPELKLIEQMPKKETLLKIMTYSKNLK